MTQDQDASALLTKARRACASAQALLALDDMDGACNRAYYAMFDAARAALLASKCPVGPGIAKTHRGLLKAFSEHLVKSGTVSRDLGRLLKRAEEFRYVADYHGSSVEPADAADIVQQAQTFVSAMTTLIGVISAPGRETDVEGRVSPHDEGRDR